MQIAFRVDASLEIGTGHFVRCLTLADALRDAGAVTRFVCRQLTPALAGMVVAQGHEIRMLPAGLQAAAETSTPHDTWLGTTQTADAESTFHALADISRWDWLIVDHYSLDESWETKLRGSADKLLVIDDLANRSHRCDVLLDQNLQPAGSDRYKDLVPATARRFVGPRFAMLRPEFRATTPRSRSGALSRVNIFFGGVDAGGTTLKALEAIETLNSDRIALDVVAGADNPRLQTIRDYCARLQRTVLHVQTREMARLFVDADLAVGAGGATSWERCALALPSLILSIADNQRSGCLALAEVGAARYLGDAQDVGIATLANAISRALNDAEALKQMACRGVALVDGRGTDRVTLHIFRESVMLRHAQQEDVDQAWSWRNDPATRQFVHDPSPIELETHRRWWRNSLDLATRDLMIAHCTGIKIGVVRFDYEDTDATISIYLDPELNGIGLGSAILRAATGWVKSQKTGIVTLRAEVLPQNIWSNRSFAAAGYISREDGIWMKEIGCDA
jgi:UDP-2,4-diacetamido-2,4,6-trideoxy-beta-L-altropyranose hydrolase